MKHFCSFVALWVTMLFAALPTAVFAQNEKETLAPLMVGNHEIDLTRSYDLTTSEFEGRIHFDAPTKTLTFEDVTFSGQVYRRTPDVHIELLGNNKI